MTVGRKLLHYELLDRLGAGGMGEVWRARDSRLDREVAIKILAPGDRTPELQERFLREARAASALIHPNIITVHEINAADGADFIVMEYVRGETLAAVVAGGPLPVRRAIQYAVQICDALQTAHEAGVIHRDLKPANIMIAASGRVTVLDFGIAKRIGGKGQDIDTTAAGTLTVKGVSLGTPAYMSPEQTLGDPVDARSDIFSFGVVLYQMLAGVLPFQASTTLSLVRQIVHDAPPPLRTVAPAVPEALAAIVNTCLEKEPNDRYATAEALGAALKLVPVPSEPQDSSAETRTHFVATPAASRATRRMPPRVAIASGLVVAVVATAWIVGPPLTRWVRDRAGSGSAEPGAMSKTAFEWANLGREYLRRFDRKGNADRAVDAFQRAIAIDANHAFAHAGLAEAFLRKDSATPDPQWVRQATEAARRSVAINPDLAAAHAALGLVQLRLKQPEEGHASLERALDLDPGLLEAHMGMGEYYIAKGDQKQAEAVYRKAMQVAPQEWLPLTQLGRSLYLQARYAEAAAAWEQAQAKSPDNTMVLRNLGAVYHMLDRTDEATAALQRALEIEPSATIYSNLGTMRFFQGRYSDAAAAFEKAVDLNPTFSQYWANLGDAYRWVPGAEAKAKAREAFARAVPLVEARLKAAPSDPDLQTQLALYLAKQGERARAETALHQWEAFPKKSPASHFRALLVHEILGDRAAALASLEAALAAGYAFKEIRDEPELARLRSDPRYHRIAAKYESPGR